MFLEALIVSSMVFLMVSPPFLPAAWPFFELLAGLFLVLLFDLLLEALEGDLLLLVLEGDLVLFFSEALVVFWVFLAVFLSSLSVDFFLEEVASFFLKGLYDFSRDFDLSADDEVLDLDLFEFLGVEVFFSAAFLGLVSLLWLRLALL